MGELRTRYRPESRVLVLADHGLGALGPETAAIIAQAQSGGAKVVAIPRSNLPEYRYVTGFVVNPAELQILASANRVGPPAGASPAEERKAADEFARKHHVDVFLTQGKEGIYVAPGADELPRRLVPAYVVEHPQLMGARDMALAIISLGYALALELTDAAALANAFAHLVVQQRGTGVVLWSDIGRLVGLGEPALAGKGT